MPSAEKKEKLHHTLGDYSIPQKIYSQCVIFPHLQCSNSRTNSITVGNVNLTDPATAPEEIDKVLRTCIAKQRPVFISLPTDVVHLQCTAPSVSLDLQPFISDQAALKECIGTLSHWIPRTHTYTPVRICNITCRRSIDAGDRR